MVRFECGYFACVLSFLVAGTPAWAAPASSLPASRSLQQQFNDASDAAAKGDCVTALPLFEGLASDARVKPGTLSAATIAVRRGLCLSDTARYDDAEAQILLGLPILRQAGPSMALDVSNGEEALGLIAMRRHDHDGAVTHFTTAMEPLDDVARLPALIKRAQATQFDGGNQALDDLDHALRIASAQPKPDHQILATIHTVRGRVLMNQGRDKEALAELQQALDLSGGLTDRATYSQVAMRGDLAEAELLNGNKDKARLYLAYTGAGRIQSSPFATAAWMAPPPCGFETGLTPEDSAIVEFGIDDAGDVPVAETVYTKGNYAVASAFADAVEQWYWRPSDLAKIPAFYRVLTRVELRCSASGGRLPGVTSPLRDRFSEWATPYLAGLDFENAKVGSSLERLATLAKQREAANDPTGEAAALTARGMLNPNAAASATDLDKALAIADGAHVPPEIVDTILVFRTDAIGRRPRGTSRLGDPQALRDVQAIAQARPTFAKDALAEDTLLMLHYPDTPALEQVADDHRLPNNHPIRQAALLRLANLSASAGKLDEAHSYFSRTGLSEEQCSLIGVEPAMKSSGASSNDFPMAALRLGFEGWVDLEFDINANGTTAHARPIIAYPPFVFVDAATGMARNIRYQTSYRPSEKLACSAHQETIRFQIPSNH